MGDLNHHVMRRHLQLAYGQLIKANHFSILNGGLNIHHDRVDEHARKAGLDGRTVWSTFDAALSAERRGIPFGLAADGTPRAYPAGRAALNADPPLPLERGSTNV